MFTRTVVLSALLVWAIPGQSQTAAPNQGLTNRAGKRLESKADPVAQLAAVEAKVKTLSEAEGIPDIKTVPIRERTAQILKWIKADKFNFEDLYTIWGTMEVARAVIKANDEDEARRTEHRESLEMAKATMKAVCEKLELSDEYWDYRDDQELVDLNGKKILNESDEKKAQEKMDREFGEAKARILPTDGKSDAAKLDELTRFARENPKALSPESWFFLFGQTQLAGALADDREKPEFKKNLRNAKAAICAAANVHAAFWVLL